MAHYLRVGDVPPKRHTQHRRPDGGLYHEELMGEEGFSSDSSLLYHRHIPSALVDARVWELPDQRTTANLPLPKPPSPEAAATRPGDLITWWTGTAVMVFSASGMRYRYTVGPADTHVPIGPATMMAGRLISPVSDGVGIYDPTTGVNERYLPLRRAPAQSAVVPGVAGSTLLEERGATLVALGG